ncbi:MAG: type II toxin-antitoxin system Phd/YefM family antitoxin [Rhodoferax sp.]|nr:type II toxin-antitoxin system Phd/YefM family antitoxin [Rhodoferax sp.]MDP3655100.1 type II toxin-antitoxin system Phd/YefM family antitoxin [Rhodoferax sp.]
MAFSASDVIPLLQARANFSELADQVKVGTEKIITKDGESYVAIIDAQRLDYYHQLEDAEAFLIQAQAPKAFDALLDELTDTVIPNLITCCSKRGFPYFEFSKTRQ